MILPLVILLAAVPWPWTADLGQSGQCLVSAGAAATPSWGSCSAAGGGVGTLLTATADTPNSTTSFANVTGLTWAASASTTYEFQCHLIFTSSVITTGVKFAVNGPAATLVSTTIAYQVLGNAAAPSATAYQWANLVAYDTGTATASVPVINTNYTAVVTGVVTVGGAGGTLAIRHGSETANLTTVKAGSWCVYY